MTFKQTLPEHNPVDDATKMMRGLHAELMPDVIGESGADLWEHIPAEPLEFIEDKNYLDLSAETRDCVKEDIVKIFGNCHDKLDLDYELVICDEAIGTGKSFKLAIASSYMNHRLLCLKNPQQALGLAPHSKIAIMNMAVSAQQARSVVYSEIRSKIIVSPWFREHYLPNPDFKTQLQFDPTPDDFTRIEPGQVYKNIFIIPGSSSEYAPAGMNTLLGCIDEATLFGITHEGKDQADVIYTALRRRAKSRFGDRFIIIVAGNPMYNDDFLERLIDAKQGHKRTLVIRRSLWDSKDAGWRKGQVFYFSAKEQVEVLPEALPPEGDKSWKHIITVPQAYHSDFEENPPAAIRELAGLPVSSIQPLFHPRKLVRDNINWERQSPVLADGSFAEWLQPISTSWHAIHIDLSSMSGLDACGISLGHVHGYDKENRPVFWIDLVLRLQGERGMPVPMRTVQKIVEELVNKGFPIAAATFDKYQSTFLAQEVATLGIMTNLRSVDTDVAPYVMLREAWIDGRVNIHPDNLLIRELEQLEIIRVGKKEKVDHPKKGLGGVRPSKDLSDAVAGCIANLVELPTGDALAGEDITAVSV